MQHSEGSTWRYLLLTFLMISMFGAAQAQDDDEDGCGAKTENKKVLKLLEVAKDRKASPDKRYAALNDAVGLDEECAECWLELGRSTYRKANSGNISYQGAIRQFESLVALCPEYHSDPFYYLGAMYYARRDYAKSMENFNKFLEFPLDDPEKLARDHEKKYADVEDILGEVEFYAEFFDNPVPFKPVRIAGVCSKDDDYLPMLTPDNKHMFYTRRKLVKPKGEMLTKEIEELTDSERQDDGLRFAQGLRMSAPFNQGDNYGGITFSVDNKEMYITICREGDCADDPRYKNCDIYVSNYTMVNGEMNWTEPVALGPEINSDCAWESQPSLSGDGKHLYFAKVNADTKGQDIYVADRGADGNWSTAYPLDGVNTDGHDKLPFIHSDSQTLYFSSDGHFGAGGFDIFYTKFENGKWTRPKNIGIPINTSNDELGLFVSTDGRLAYFASDRLEGAQKIDVFGFELHKKARPKKILLIQGEMTDDDGEALRDAKIELHYAESKQVQEIKVDTIDGRYAAVVALDRNEQVVMTVKKKGHALTTRLIDPEVLDVDTSESAPNSAAVVEMAEVKVERITRNKAFRINDILYSTKKFGLDRKDKFILKQFADYLMENPKMRVAIHGHTDNIGDPADNLKLSQNRADGVKEHLISLGVPSSRLESKGFGETKPEASNDTAKGRAQNRRTEFMILSF